MPTQRPGGGIPGRPQHPGGPRPGDNRRPRPGGAGRPRRDPEAERESKILQQQRAARAAQAQLKAKNTEIVISEGATVKELAEKLGIKANVLIKSLFERGIMSTINQTLDMQMIKDLSKLYGASVEELSFEEETTLETDLAEDPSQLETRAPVVTVMGHVDHGKTSLLDALRDTHIADREAGGITQAIGASQIEHNGRKIVFVDTPGHEAFTRMRAQGAKVTDVVILVVAADDGVMPQTLEAIDHAKAAGVPIVVAVNKIDKNNAQPDRVKQQLSDRGLMPEEWGGDTVFVNVSAIQRTNLDQLLEMVLLTADLRELKANPNRAAVGTVLESKLDRGQGPVATVIVQNGTLRVGDYFVVGSVFGRVRALIDHQGKKLNEAGPSTAVVVLGLEDLPQPGDQLTVVTDTDRAKKIVEHREQKEREQQLAASSRLSLEQFQDKLKRGEVKELPIILKADVQGSLDVLEDMLRKLKTEKVAVQIVRTGVGAISESDVLLAITAGAIIVGFNVRPERSAAVLADREHVEIRLHTVIYELSDELKKALAGLLAPVIKEEFQGRAQVKEVFHVSKIGTVAGCLLEEGKATSKSKARLLRDNIVVYTGALSSLRRFKDDVSEVRAGQECGMTLHNYNDIKQGDVIELFQNIEVAQELNL
ncbi:MAG: translation initiation factor IF-2 [Bryobacterales bacterium]